MASSDSNWKILWHAFDQLINVPKKQRAQLLDHLSAGNNDLKHKLANLLEAHESSSALLDQQPHWQAQLHQSFQPPDHIQGFIIDKKLGSGGIGEVYLAHKKERGFSRTVAIKFATAGRFSPHVLSSFNNELKALLKLNHPHIERLYDGGITEQGVPFLIVEYIEGVHLDLYCNQHHLNLTQRLLLFEKICLAVDYMHRSLIIHRDIKTDNIMVDIHGEPKLVDFGLAKLSNKKTDSKTSHTTYSSHMMTLAFASPEQINGANITTSTDIYSLGIILYQLLTGQLPYTIDHSNLQQSFKTITSFIPKLASTHIKQDAVIQQTETNLKRKLSGDLEQIIAKSLAKQVERRYLSALQFSQDIRRYLQHKPVSARPDSISYVFGKFVQRHTLGFTFTALAVMALLVLSTQLFFQSKNLEQSLLEVQQEQARVQKVTTFLTDIFNNTDPLNTNLEIIKVSDLLDYSSSQLTNQFNDDPLTKATLYLTLSSVYLNMSQLDQAQLFLKKAKKLFIQQQNTAGLIDAHLLMSKLLTLQNKFVQSEEEINKIKLLENFEKLPLTQQIALQIASASNKYEIGNYQEARTLYESAEKKIHQDNKQDHSELGLVYLSLGNIFWREGKLQQVEIYYQKSYEINTRLFGREHHKTLKSQSSLGVLSYAKADYKTALKHFKSVSNARINRLGIEHITTAASLNRLGTVYFELGQYQQAQQHLTTALNAYEALNMQHSSNYALVLNNLALVLRQTKDYKQAQSMFMRSHQIEKNILGDKHSSIAASANNLGLVAADLGDFETAITYFQQAHDILYHNHALENVGIAYSMTNLARIYIQLNDLQKAKQWIKQALVLRKNKLGTDNLNYAESLSVSAYIDINQGNYTSARDKVSKVLQIREAQLPKNDRHIAEARLMYALTVNAYDEAQASLLFQCYLPLMKERLGPDHYRLKFFYQKAKALEIKTEQMNSEQPSEEFCFTNNPSTAIKEGTASH